jgi:DNA-binding NarL/FixJ family response regulator
LRALDLVEENSENMSFQRRILIVEDDEFTGSLMSTALEGAGFETSVAVSAIMAKKQLQKLDPDAVIVDIDLGDGPNGIEFAQLVRKSRPGVAVILLTKHGDSVSAGFSDSRIPEGVAYLRKSLLQSTEALVAALETALHGQAGILRQDRIRTSKLDLLTAAQREILRLMAAGLSNKAIAEQRGTSLSSVEQLVTGMFKTLGVSEDQTIVPRVEAIRLFAEINGLPKRNRQ